MQNMSYQDPIDKISNGGVDPSRGDYSQRNHFPDEEPPEDPRGILAYFFKALQKGIDTLLGKTKETLAEDFSAKRTLKSLRTSLEILKLEDRSQDIHFLNDLAEKWNLALEESLNYNETAAAVFKVFVKKILHYPENEPHTFGYYLTEHAGQKWIPFPYMELVQKIHSEHEKNPNSSVLVEWTRLLDDTTRLLQKT